MGQTRLDPDYTEITVSVLHETLRAYKVMLLDFVFWIPKSQIRDPWLIEDEEEITIEVADWILLDNGVITE